MMISYVVANILLSGVLGEALSISPDIMKFYISSFIWMCIVISYTALLIISKIVYGDVRPEVKHIVIILLTTYLFFNLIMNVRIGLSIPSI